MSVVTLADAKTHLNITSTTWDTEIQAFLDRCEAAISRQVGPLAATSVTAPDVRGGGGQLVLPTTPVISLTSVTDVTGGTLSVSDLHVTSDGVVSLAILGGGGFVSPWGWFVSPWYTVVYQAGRATLPDDLKLAVLEMVRHKWVVSQRAPGSASADMIPGAAYTFPYSVSELIAPHLQMS